MALRNTSAQPPLLQTTVLRHKKPPMHPDDTRTELLHHALQILLAHTKRRHTQSEVAGNPSIPMGRTARNSRSLPASSVEAPNRIQRQLQNKQGKAKGSPQTQTRSHKLGRRTNTLPTSKRINHMLPPKKLHNIPCDKRNDTRGSDKNQRRTHPALCFTLRL